ncbi:RNA polymerase sigma-70 factor [Agriterribacter sp.]|uniref:RNA polymerase sigma factor n=1 Tax=Agriterribacter sp. TaxID=2821509 RepID=UPI002C9D9603|nr:RNA polymerase sigma-70 factor [Agriterribacter sp.]HRO46011.1 RNA polymerase sigma-70 factor [Agriterribacter sp.]HRQ17047.1 RNA polymerase sigma-70 factor [Agriterribacter sp.]
MSNTNTYHETALLHRVAEGDELAFRQVYDHYTRRIYSYALNLTESEDKAAEVVQEVFLKLWQNRQKLPEVQQFNAWLHAIARNVFFNAIKRKAQESVALRQLYITRREAIHETEYFVLDRENDALLQQALARLPDQQKLVFQLRSQGMKQDEIASQLQISKNTVKVHLNRALNSIRDYLGTHTDTALSLLVILLSGKQP